MTDTIDPRVASAAQHWTHRMVTNGVPLADFQDVTGSITKWDEWCAAWVARGEVHESLGKTAEEGGHHLSAGSHFARAAVCHHFGKFLFTHDKVQMMSAHNKAILAHGRALPYLDPPGERIIIPYEGSTLAAVLRKPRGVDRPPVVVMCMGLDSAKEEMRTNEDIFLARGMATLAFDGPGQGEAEYALPIEPEYERPVAAVIDWIETRNDIDTSRIGLWGVSLGGYSAPRAAAFETRVRACISLTGPFDFAEAFDRAPPLTRAAFAARCHVDNEDAARDVAARMSLADVAGQIRCPLYIVGGALDRVLPPDHAQKLAEACGGEATLNMVEDGTHVVNNRPYKYRPQSADWMMSRLLK
ncbi:MAG: alpha/beta hydrolase [Silicimonas sp.]|nr:alpha/beta hydrolase [Silicimonas sp.]